jgi:hypothetical protein
VTALDRAIDEVADDAHAMTLEQRAQVLADLLAIERTNAR